MRVELSEAKRVWVDFGRMSSSSALALGVLHPASAEDITKVVGAAYESGVRVSARGEGHSIHGQRMGCERLEYVEGFVIVDEALINNWRSSFFSPSNPVTISSLNAHADGGVLYCLEFTKNYHVQTHQQTLDQEIENLLEKLDFIETSVFTTDVAYVDFLDRVHKAELKLRSKGLWDVPHPWLNLFVPKSRIADFDKGVFKGILGNKTSGPILIYPMNNNKWDERSSAVTVEEEVFYLVAFLRSALDSERAEYLEKENREILKYCDDEGIKVKQYLPHYTNQKEWMDHFGDKWDQFYQRKMQFDPRRILATGQRIFNPISISNQR
ncbi:cytokinin dehydrogenase 5 [Senna tora]|uniref:Cytokinin dehydrogenase 5 n=1 Tax=Senna tora TaxID=362788 RepID=A0A834T901_9FABA|nr:cytokinin dehydrogenase 5 [Senna tora]